MMRNTLFVVYYFACLLLLVSPIESASLRRVKGGWELQADLSEARELQAHSAFENSHECPVEMPEVGSACNISEPIKCAYGKQTCCGRTYPSLLLDCSDDGRWVISRVDDTCLFAPPSCRTGFEDDNTPLSDDASIINGIIQLFLPLFNTVFQAIVPDPLELPFAGSQAFPGINLFGCNVDVSFNFKLGDLVGLSGVSIDSLTIQPGTESVDAGCWETIFSAVFDLAVSSVQNFGLQGLTGGLEANICGVPFSDGITGGVDTYAPTFRGVTSISGLLFGNLATITFAESARVFDIGYDSIEAYVVDFPPEWNVFIRDASRQLGNAMKGELAGTVEATVNQKSTESMEGQAMTLSNAQAMRIRTRFMRNKVRRQVAQAYQSTANFIGNTVSFLSFGLIGNKENGEE